MQLTDPAVIARHVAALGADGRRRGRADVLGVERHDGNVVVDVEDRHLGRFRVHLLDAGAEQSGGRTGQATLEGSAWELTPRDGGWRLVASTATAGGGLSFVAVDCAGVTVEPVRTQRSCCASGKVTLEVVVELDLVEVAGGWQWDGDERLGAVPVRFRCAACGLPQPVSEALVVNGVTLGAGDPLGRAR